MFRFLILIGFSILTVPLALATEAGSPILFEKDVRPVFKTHCFHCHGEDGVTEGGLDLRLRRLIAQGGDSGSAIESESSDESLLMEHLESGEMPPGDKTLPTQSIELIRRWIDQGAKTARAEPESIGEGDLFSLEEREFWSFQPLVRPSVPAVKNVECVSNPVDAFVLAKLESKGLAFSKTVQRHDLARRLFFDLVGLPPSPAELERFLSDDSPIATSRLIDRLMSSPHYGERWGRHWLDVAGYADSEGYAEEDRVRDSAFRYRDYVIDSINRDKPWDQFVREQLAGDEMISPPYTNLSEQNVERLTATGFLRMAPDGTASGGIDQNLARNQTIADTIDIVSTSLLGLTVACAQCHNHRYDPISQVDYYRMRAIFSPALDWKQWRNPNSRRVSLYTDEQRAIKKELEAEIAEVNVEKKTKTDYFIELTLQEELDKVAEALRQPLRDAYKTVAAKRSAEQKQLLADHPSVQNISPGSLYLYDNKRVARARKIDLDRAGKAKQYVKTVREKALSALSVADRENLLATEKIKAADRTTDQKQIIAMHAIVAVTEATLKDFDADAAAQLEADKKLAVELRGTKSVNELKKFTDQIAEIRLRMPEEGFVRALTEQRGKMLETFVFIRGDHEQPGEKVSPGDLSVLEQYAKTIDENSPSLPTTGRRLAYAKNLTSGRHPLVARVIVNRVWAQHFGRGIVSSLGDFGVLGERPTHPGLLDWLASEFVDSGWSLKRLHRLIVNSTAYQQASTRTPELDRVDPDNRLYARCSVRRLESEAYRDSVLAVSGQLNRTIFGKPVPVKEDDVGQIVLGAEKLDGERKPVEGDGLGDQVGRRSLYVQVRRSRVLGVLETFDTPVMTPNCTKRSASNVAPQPLLMMNSDFSIKFSAKLAERLRTESGDDVNAQVTLLWLLTQGTKPSPDERSSAVDYLKAQSSALQNPGSEKNAESEPRQDALASLCHALLSTNRFLYID